jgi:hypothetical protein
LHYRAAVWHEQHSFLRRAIKHYLAASSWEKAAALIYRQSDELQKHGENITFLRWMQGLPDSVIQTHPGLCLEYAWALGHHSSEFKGRLERLLKIAGECSTPFDLYEPFYNEFLVTFPPWEAVWTMEMVPCALAICAIAGEDTKQAIIGATNIGRDADTIAGIAGELAGALYGIDALPTPWTEKVLELNPSPDMEKMAQDLSILIANRNQAQIEMSTKLLSVEK